MPDIFRIIHCNPGLLRCFLDGISDQRPACRFSSRLHPDFKIDIQAGAKNPEKRARRSSCENDFSRLRKPAVKLS